MIDRCARLMIAQSAVFGMRCGAMAEPRASAVATAKASTKVTTMTAPVGRSNRDEATRPVM
jgi:hypothetical protein